MAAASVRLNTRVRLATHAGSWYSHEDDVLDAQLGGGSTY